MTGETFKVMTLSAKCNHNANYMCCMLSRAAGHMLTKEVTLDANNSSDNKNLFKITGTILIEGIFAEITDATTLTNCTNVYLDLYDGAFADIITLDGATISGFNVGGYLHKEQDSTNALHAHSNATCLVSEPSDKKVHHPFLVTQKSGADTYIRLHYTTTDAPINAKIMFFVCAKCVNGGTITEV